MKGFAKDLLLFLYVLLGILDERREKSGKSVGPFLPPGPRQLINFLPSFTFGHREASTRVASLREMEVVT